MLSYITLFGTFVAYTATTYGKSSSSSYTYCYNYTECENDTISTKYAACYGYYGCDDADIESSYTLAYGELGCYDATIDSPYTYAYGHYGAYASSVSTYHLYGYGYESVRVADIEPYSDELLVYFYGYFSGYGADVSCYSGDYCYIYCGSGHGCYGVDFYCYSGATCYYDCSGDDVCPTSYSGVDSDLTYVTSIGTTQASSSYSTDLREELAILFTGLTDDEITEYKLGNQLAKDKSRTKLQQDTLDDTDLQLRMTYEQEYWLTGAQVQKAEQERERQREKEEQEQNEDERDTQYANINAFKSYKNNVAGSGQSVFSQISLEEFSTALVVDICIIAIVIQTYNYCMKAKEYQSL